MGNDQNEVLFDDFGNPLNENSTDSSDNSSISSIIYDGEQQSNSFVVQDSNTANSLISGFDETVETIIATSDAMSIDEPIIKPEVVTNFMIEESSLPQTSYSKEYLWETAKIPERVRNVALCGNIHSGKSSILDMLIQQTHDDITGVKYADNHILEQNKGISIKSSAMSLLLPNLEGHSTVVNFVDSPGHTNFVDEMILSIRLTDITVLCVDVIESVTKALEITAEYCIRTNTPMCLMLTKIDRLILELKLSPLDSYYKIRRTIEEVNELLKTKCVKLNVEESFERLRLSPELHNVCFSSSVFGTIFSLKSFALNYIDSNMLHKNKKITVDNFSIKLWGDIYFADRKFFVRPKEPLKMATSRTFIKFILDPIYKMTLTAVSLDANERQKFVESNLKLHLKSSLYKIDSQPFMKVLFSAFFGLPSLSLVSCLNHLPSPKENAFNKLSQLYTGPHDSSFIQSSINCDSTQKVVAYVSKLVDTRDNENFYAFIRIVSGTLKSNQIVKLLGENYSLQNADDYKLQKISKCYIWCGRYKIEVPELYAGNIGLISGPGIDKFIVKTATIYDSDFNDEIHKFRAIEHIVVPTFKVALQAFNPKDLNKFLSTMKKIDRSYIGCEVKVEDNGEYSIIGYGELYMDCLLHDFRQLYGNIDIKVSDPMVRFSETTDSISKVKLVIHSSNGKNSISITAEPLDSEIVKDMINGTLDIKRETPRQFAKKLRDRYHWDSFAARSVWDFGPGSNGTCMLCDDTLAEDVDKSLLNEHKNAILKGFQWAVQEGPLCDEPISNVKFNVIDIHLAEGSSERNDAQIIQMVQKACHAAILIGVPKMMEPIYFIETICHVDALEALDKLIDKRRGFVEKKLRIEGTPLWRVVGFLPVIESVGIETDLRLATRGKAYPQMVFDRWEIVPGNPLDKTAFIPQLKRAPINSTSRDFMIKTRKRKGLSIEVSLRKYVSDETWNMLSELDIV